MRLIGGFLKGRKLVAPQGTKIRPTADRVREAIFNIIGGRVSNAYVCDLFAGTGAFGIEALSRGARSAVFIDVDRTAINLVLRNLERCGLRRQSRVIRWDIRRGLQCLDSDAAPFDLVFLDPPYNHGMLESTLSHLLQSGCLDPAAWVVAEHAPAETVDVESHRLHLFDQRRYGKTLVSFFRPVL